MKIAKMVLASLALLTFAACSGGGSSPLPATVSVASAGANTDFKKPTDQWGNPGGPLLGGIAAIAAVTPVGTVLSGYNGGGW